MNYCSLYSTHQLVEKSLIIKAHIYSRNVTIGTEQRFIERVDELVQRVNMRVQQNQYQEPYVQ